MNQPLTPEQTKSAYQRVCGKCHLPIHNAEVGIRHYGLYEAHSEQRCIELLKLDAHEADQLRSATECELHVARATSEEQAAQIAAMQAALAQGGHADECRKRCCECLPLYLKTGADCAKCDCNCYLSTFSDDVKRGKELLGAVEELKLWRKFLNPGEELSNAIARLNDDAMKERP